VLRWHADFDIFDPILDRIARFPHDVSHRPRAPPNHRTAAIAAGIVNEIGRWVDHVDLMYPYIRNTAA
jgi:hypothetical protein